MAPRTPSRFELPIQIGLTSDVPLHRQVSDWFRQAIIEGRLRLGQRMPSSRNLAEQLGISRNPALVAYDHLVAEGYFEAFTGAGTRVARALPEDALKPASPDSPGPQPRSTKISSARTISRRSAAVPVPVEPWLHNMEAFRIGAPALDHFPFRIWSKLVNRHARRPVYGLDYGDGMGYLPLREAIAEYLGVFRAVRCDVSQVLITAGSKQGLQLCAQVLLDPGQPIWMEEPGYPGVRQVLLATGLRLVPVPVDGQGLDVAAGIRLEPSARAAYVTPSHQFPMGVTMSAARRMQLLDWAAREGAWVLEDDYDSEYRFSGRPLASLQGLDADARVIYVGTFSKTVFPALRLGYLVVPKDLIQPFAVARDAADSGSSALDQSVMADFILEGHFARHIRRTRTAYMEQRAALVEAIRSFMPDTLEVIGDEAGLHLTALLRRGVDDVAVSQKAAEKGVSVRPLSGSYIGPYRRSGLILGYGGARVEAIPKAIQVLQSCI